MTMAEKEKIQEAPEGWRVGTISDIAYINPPQIKVNRNIQVSFIPMEAISEEGKIIQYQERYCHEVNKGYTAFKENDVLFAKITPCMENGKGALAVGLTNSVGFGSTEFHVIRAKNDNSSKYIYYLTLEKRFRQKAKNNMTGTAGQQRVPASFLLNYNIIFPPEFEQSRIAFVLSTCDEAIEKTDVKIEKLKRIKQGLMQGLFRYGIDENGKMRSETTHRFKDSPLGRIPVEWEVVNIFDVCKLINGRAFKPSEWSESGLPIIRIENLNKGEAEFNYCNFRVAAKHLIFKGDLLISWSGTPGTSFGIFEWGCGEAVLNQHIFKVILGSSIEKKYFYYSYINLLDEMIRQSHGGVGLQHITKEDLKRLRILLPKKPEQSRIASVLSAADEAIEKEEAYKNKLLALKRGLMDDLLSGKVGVNKLIKEAA